MANRAYLFNTSVPVCNRIHLHEASARDGSPCAEVAQGANQIPAIWFFCFRKEDLIPATLSFGHGAGVVHRQILLPCAPVEHAVRNLVAARALLDAFVGDRALVEDYWQAAVDTLRGLALPYLAMDPTEIFLLNDPDEEALAFVKAFEGGEAAFEAIRLLSFYEKDQAPYAYEEFMSGGVLDHAARRRNSAALLGGFAVEPEAPVDAAQMPMPMPMPVAARPDFTRTSVPSIVMTHAPASVSFDTAAIAASVQRASMPQGAHRTKGDAKPKPWWKLW
ncbi:hypothetical protein ACSFB6_14810 [Variovorax sp. GB4R4]